MEITKIEAQKKKTDRVSVFLDGVFAFGLPASDALYYKLKEGESLSPEKYQVILQEIVLNKARDSALHYLSYRPRSEQELRRHLKTKDFGEDVVGQTVELMKKYHYIDDFTFACAYISDAFRLKKWGGHRIRYALAQAGVADDIIHRAMEQTIEEKQIDSTEVLVSLLEKKLGDTPDEKAKARAFRYLAGKGFDYEDIEAAYAKLNRPLRE